MGPDTAAIWFCTAALLLGSGEARAAGPATQAAPATQPTTRPAPNEQPVALYCLDADLCEYVREACAAAVATFPGEHPVVVLAFGHRWGDEGGNIECPDGQWLSFEEAADVAAAGYPGHPLYLVVFEIEYGDQG